MYVVRVGCAWGLRPMYVLFHSLLSHASQIRTWVREGLASRMASAVSAGVAAHSDKQSIQTWGTKLLDRLREAGAA